MLLSLAITLVCATPPNVLFLLSDDQRPDTVRALGNPHIDTPHLDGLVRDGVTFTRATCAYPLCVPSRWAATAWSASRTCTNTPSAYR